MLLVTGRADDSYPVRFLCGVEFVACVGARGAVVGFDPVNESVRANTAARSRITVKRNHGSR